VEVLEDRLLPSFSWGEVNSPDVVQTRSQQAAPLISSAQLGGSSANDVPATLIRLRRVVGDAAATQGVQPSQITLNYAKIESLQTIGGGVTSPEQTSLQAPAGGTTVVTTAVDAYLWIDGIHGE
jgi:hypothetical protein